MPKTKYQKLQTTKTKFCEGKATKSDVTKAASEYVKDTVAKGNKTKAEAEKSANRVLNSGCPISGVKSKKRSTKGKAAKGKGKRK